MSGKPIDYAALAAGVRQHIRFRENSVPRVPSVAELREWEAALTAAQQQGQAVATLTVDRTGAHFDMLPDWQALPHGKYHLYTAPPPSVREDVARAMADEYKHWIDFYHRGEGDYADFLRHHLATQHQEPKP